MTRLICLPLAVLFAAFAILCVHHGTAWPWNVVVHEDGHRTLLQTIFYFDHAAGELPLDLLLSAAVAGAFPAAAPRPIGKLIAVCLTLDAIVVIGAKTPMLNLLQFHTRDGEPLAYGSHWHYHLLSQAALMLLPLVFMKSKRNAVLIPAWTVFAAVTILFGINSATFLDPRYLGHQARELFTYTLVTIPLAVASVTYLVGRTPRSAAGPPARFKFNWKPFLAFLVLTTYLATAVLITGARHQAQSNDWTAVICAHFFEHTFSYLIVPAHAQLFYLLGAKHA